MRRASRLLLIPVLLGIVGAPRAAHADEAAPVAPAPQGPPWLGVTMDHGSDIGVRVQHVVRGAPAERAGVRTGDRIVGIAGTRVTSPAHVSREVGARKVGDTLALELERAGASLTMSAVLAARPSADDMLRMDLVGAPAPAFARATPLAGAPASLSELRGRVVLVDFWASWCGPCRMIAPRLSSLRARLGAQGLSVVGVTTDEPERAAVFAERLQMRYPVVVDGLGETTKAYGVASLPTLVLIDKRGVVRDVLVGFDPGGDARLEAAVRALLVEPPPPPEPAPSRAAKGPTKPAPVPTP